MHIQQKRKIAFDKTLSTCAGNTFIKPFFPFILIIQAVLGHNKRLYYARRVRLVCCIYMPPTVRVRQKCTLLFIRAPYFSSLFLCCFILYILLRLCCARALVLLFFSNKLMTSFYYVLYIFVCVYFARKKSKYL